MPIIPVGDVQFVDNLSLQGMDFSFGDFHDDQLAMLSIMFICELFESFQYINQVLFDVYIQ